MLPSSEGRGHGYVAVSRFRSRRGCYLYGRVRRTDFLPVGEEREDEVLERGYDSEDTSEDEDRGLEYAFAESESESEEGAEEASAPAELPGGPYQGDLASDCEQAAAERSQGVASPSAEGSDEDSPEGSCAGASGSDGERIAGPHGSETPRADSVAGSGIEEQRGCRSPSLPHCSGELASAAGSQEAVVRTLDFDVAGLSPESGSRKREGQRSPSYEVAVGLVREGSHVLSGEESALEPEFAEAGSPGSLSAEEERYADGLGGLYTWDFLSDAEDFLRRADLG